MPRRQQVKFLSLLGQLIQSGYSINQATKFIQQISHDNVWIKDLNLDLAKGKNFALAIKPYLNSSLNFQIGMANRYGNLEKILLQLADFSEKCLKQENKIKQILRYPIVLVILLIGIAIAVKIFLLPILSSWSDQQPIDPVDEYFWPKVFGIMLLILLFFFYRWKSFKKISKLRQLAFYTKIPLFGKTLNHLINYQFSLQLSMLTASGLQISQIAKDITKNHGRSIESDFAAKLVEMLESGQSFSDYFHELSFLDPTINIYFQQGADKELLNRNLQIYSKISYEKFLTSVDHLIGLIQPLSFVIVGMGIVLLYLSMLMPMYQTLGGLNQ
ncbi:type II secretion system protein F [Oenococcus sp. UCMA 16435]|nr:type II secretion system protein F [Oenococcus sp. UCMA 16435]MDI4584830.1 type II secretion system protein F [Oenococcus sp. UCMA 14587]MDN6967597.1 type II secretion system protein F [Oenococcus sp. UCMA 17063]